MANRNLYGLRWKYSTTSNDCSAPIVHKRVATAFTNTISGVSVNINPGDPVKLVNDGTVVGCDATDRPFGVCAAIVKYYSSTKKVVENGGRALPVGTTYTAGDEQESIIAVIPVAGQVFEAVCDDATLVTRATFQAIIGENVDLSFGSASATTGFAWPMLDLSGHATSAALNWRVVGLADTEFDVDYTVLNVPLLVTANLTSQAPYYTTGT